MNRKRKTLTIPRWSLITVSYNSAADLESHWRTMRPKGVEWIVVDNASSDESVHAARKLGADRVIALDANVGFGAANNVGYRASRGQCVAFVNPDVSVDFESLAALADTCNLEPCLIGPQLTYPDGTLQPSGRGAPTLPNKVLGRLGVKRTISNYYVFAGPDEVREVAWVIGAAVAGARSTLNRLGTNGPWDESFFVYYEDSDLGMRAWRAGIPVRIDGRAQWIHSWARETTKFRLRPWLLEARSMATFYRRYPRLLLGVGMNMKVQHGGSRGTTPTRDRSQESPPDHTT